MITLQDIENGSVSHGTLRSEDLIPVFLDVLHMLNERLYWSIVGEFSGYENAPLTVREDFTNKAELVLEYVKGYGEYIPDRCQEDADYLLNEVLFDALNTCATNSYYFGSHPGNDSDFGFWPIEWED